MKKAVAPLLAVLVLTVMAPFTSAQDGAGPSGMARFFDEDTLIFFSMRIDDAYLDALSGIANRVAEKLPEGAVPGGLLPLDLRALLDQQLATGPISLADIRGAIGDYAAVGIADVAALGDGQGEGLALAVPVVDRAALESLIEANIPDAERDTLDNATVYDLGGTNGVIVVADDVAYIVGSVESLPTSSRTLADSEGFIQVTEGLPADSYNIYIYLDYRALLEAGTELAGINGQPVLTPDLLAMLPEDAAVGFTILDDSVLTMDQVINLPPAEGMTTPLDPAFAASLPNGLDYLAWSSNLAAFGEALIETLPSSLAAAQLDMTEDEIAQEIENALQMLEQATGINLREDVLAWMDGDYAIFADVSQSDLVSLIAAGIAGTAPNVPTVPVEFGLVATTSDPATTAETIVRLATLLRAAAANTNGQVTIEDVTDRDGFSGVAIDISVPVMGPTRTIGMNLLLGNTDTLFYFGTAASFDRIAEGDTLEADVLFNRALDYSFKNQVSFVYTDDEGLATLVGLGAASAMITISPLVEPLQSAESFLSSATALLESMTAIFDHAIITSAFSADGLSLTRATIALK